MISKNKTISTIGVMMIITLVGKVMGVLRDRMQAVYFGTYTIEGIAFMQAVFLPRVFLDVMFASVLSASFIPVFNKHLETKGKQAALNMAALFVLVVFVVTFVITAIAMVLTGPIYGLFLDGQALAPEVRVLGIQLLRMMFPVMVLSSLAFSLTGILQSLGQFNIPAAMSVASNGIILLYYFFFIDRYGVYGLVIAFLIGWGAQVVIQVPFLIKHNFFKSRPRGDLREIGQLTLPVMVASWLGPINFFVNFRASVNLYGGEHGIVAINYAHSLYTVITGLFVLSVANVLFPTLSKYAALENWAEYTTFLRGSLRGMIFLLLPMTFGMMALARPLVSLVLQGGRFQETSVDITATALFFFSIGIVGFGMQVVLSRACFALQDGKGPLVASLVAIVINLVLSFTLAPVMEIAGPALASAVSISIAATILFIRLRRKLPEELWTSSMTFDTVKMLILAVVMYGAAIFTLGVFEGNRILVVALPAGVGLLVYMTGALVLKVPEAKVVFSWLVSLTN